VVVFVTNVQLSLFDALREYAEAAGDGVVLDEFWLVTRPVDHEVAAKDAHLNRLTVFVSVVLL
jgi:hypothetical protein